MKKSFARYIWHIAMAVTVALLWGCSSTRHVPDGKLLLDNVSINIDNDTIDVSELYNFLRQNPNHKVLGFVKLRLATYNLSGRDSTKWYNRWLRSIGQPPVIYDSDLTEKSRLQLRQALVNRGYMDVNIEVDTIANPEKKRMDVNYMIHAGEPHTLGQIEYRTTDAAIDSIIFADSTFMVLRQGDLFDRNRLDNLRDNITAKLRDHGYYNFNKEYITFIADTVEGSKVVDLTLTIRDRADRGPGTTGPLPVDSLLYNSSIVRNVYFVTDYNPQTATTTFDFPAADTVAYKGIYVLYGADRYLKPSVLEEKCYIAPGKPYSATDVERTYRAMGQLGILKYVNIAMRPAGRVGNIEMLDAYVLMTRNRKQGLMLEVEGTNSEGDLGFGVGATYQNRNLARGSEMLTAKLRTSYESLSGNFEGLVNNRYTEYAGEVGITFPKFKFPFLPSELKKRIFATTEFALSMNYQERPEYTRIIAGGDWEYKWTRSHANGYLDRHNFDLLDINYVKLPRSTLNFIDSIAPQNPLLRYSYEDHFIMRQGYTFMRTNKQVPTSSTNTFALQPSITTMRFSGEVAGSLLHAFSKLTGQKTHDGAYQIFGIQYAQYAKAEADYSYTRNLNARNSISFHIGGGIAVPYGNSQMVPFEKRFYAGGANSVRGWSVRTLGPGSYDSRNSVTDFINQCGDILLNMGVEYRTKIYWVFEGALFIDAGNIWTIRDYENQPGGVFRFNTFYKQIAASYGAGLRMDFTYFLLRFDLGLKAHNPATNQEPWPLLHPNWHRDATFHFAVGYPF